MTSLPTRGSRVGPPEQAASSGLLDLPGQGASLGLLAWVSPQKQSLRQRFKARWFILRWDSWYQE